MHLKTIQMDSFQINIIINIHILSLKKVLPKCENCKQECLVLTPTMISGEMFIYTHACPPHAGQGKKNISVHLLRSP